MNNFSEKANFIWSIANLLRDTFKRSKYQDVILPLTVLRRIDCVLEPTKEKVLETYAKLKGKLDNLAPQLCKASGFAFYNTSPFTFEKLLQDAPNLAANLNAYINGFSDNMREVLEKFDLRNTIAKLEEAGLLFLVMERFKGIDLHPDKVPNLEMGYIFEELIRRFNEALNENPGEHFTPREVIRLMVNLLLSQDQEALSQNHIVRTVYDPCCGSGGMLTIAKERILEINPKADVHLFGQEVNPETFAVCKSDLYMKSADGRDAENIKYGSTLSEDHLSHMRFDYLLTNPPFGKEWKKDEAAVRAEAERGYAGRFGAGLPRISDGQLLFLMHMVARMKAPHQGGGRIAIVMNGSPLFTGDAVSGESEIRRWILENDFLEAIIALPEQLFYNTGIATYVWILTNRKERRRRHKVQLINASSFWTPMKKSLGDKRRQIAPEQIEAITQIYRNFEEGEYSKIFDTEDFGYRKITIERPLRLNFQVTPERLARLQAHKAFLSLAESKKKDAKQKSFEEMAGRQQQEAILGMLAAMPDILFKDRSIFEHALEKAAKTAQVKLSAPIRKAILAALSERDETAEICRDAEGHPEPDPELRDFEQVPLKEDIYTYFDREVRPHVPDAWINTAVRDHKDGEVGKVGYEINFNRYFYKYQPPRPLEEIEADIKQVEREILEFNAGGDRMPGISTFDSTKELLPDILKSIREGKTQLPDFQGGWIWDDEHIKSLLARIEQAMGKPIAREAVPEPTEAVADYQDEEEEAS
jgi:type I restriction enzyme M protein